MIVKSIKAGEYSKALSKSYGWLHGLATVCRRYLFDTSNLVLSRKIWLVSEMIDQEVVEQSAVSKQAPDNIDMRESITIFPKTLFQGKASSIFFILNINNTFLYRFDNILSNGLRFLGFDFLIFYVFLVIKGDNGQLRASEPKRLMPPQIKYEVLTPTKVYNIFHFGQIVNTFFREMNEGQSEIHLNSSQRKNLLLVTMMRMTTKTLIQIMNKMWKTKTLK